MELIFRIYDKLIMILVHYRYVIVEILRFKHTGSWVLFNKV